MSAGGVLVNTPVLWGYLPVKMDEREGQHSESVTVWLEKDSPALCMAFTCGMWFTRADERSSVRTHTVFGRPDARTPGRRARARIGRARLTAFAVIARDRTGRREGAPGQPQGNFAASACDGQRIPSWTA